MEVSLTPGALQSVERLTASHAGLVEALGVERWKVKTQTVIRAPYVAWRLTLALLINEAFRRDGKRRDVPRPTGTAIKRIARELNAVDRHPAMRGLAVIGWQAITFPVWWGAAGYFPAPMPSLQFVVLKPEWTIENGKKITTWSPTEGVAPEGDRLLMEETHLSVVRASG